MASGFSRKIAGRRLQKGAKVYLEGKLTPYKPPQRRTVPLGSPFSVGDSMNDERQIQRMAYA